MCSDNVCLFYYLFMNLLLLHTLEINVELTCQLIIEQCKASLSTVISTLVFWVTYVILEALGFLGNKELREMSSSSCVCSTVFQQPNISTVLSRSLLRMREMEVRFINWNLLSAEQSFQYWKDTIKISFICSYWKRIPFIN